MADAPAPAGSDTGTSENPAPNARRPVIHNANTKGAAASPTTAQQPPRRPIIHNANVPAADQSRAGPSSSRRSVGNSILVNTCQKGNPILNLLQQTPWEYSEMVSDYQVGATSGVLFLSLRYHRLHPEYVQRRIEKLGRAYTLRIILVLCDVDDSDASLRELTKIGINQDFTVMVAFSNAEAARYLALYKAFERKPPDLIRERTDSDYLSRISNTLTQVRGVNRTDVMTLCSNFGSLKRQVEATSEEMLMCPGLGEKKVKRLREAFESPFVLTDRKKLAKGTSDAEKRGRVGNALN